MNIETGHFKNIERAAYELPSLLKNLPAFVLESESLTEDEQAIAEAAECHAMNASENLMIGIEAIGHLLFCAGTNEGFPLDASGLTGIGSLLTHLAVEVQYLQETESSLRNLIQRAAAPAARKSVSKKGVAS